jgi:hypothetical protein
MTLVTIPDKSLPLADPKTGRISLEWYSTLQSLARIANKVPSRPGLRQLLVPTSDLPLVDSETGRITLEWYRLFNATVRAADDVDANDIESIIRAVTLIPGSTEFGYHTSEVRVDGGAGSTYTENRHTYSHASDYMMSMDELAAALPECETVSLFVSWFGTDLRCGSCEIKPRVDTSTKATTPISWGVAGLTRATAETVTTVGFRPAYGGTPSDQTIIACIQDIKARGYGVIYTPFIVMDIEQGNALPDPYTGATGQPAYPWRGRITCDPAPGVMGSPDETATAGAQVDAFYGTVTAADFSVSPGSVSYSGPAEWSYSRCILYQAALCAAAGGVDIFMIGSEMRGLTWVRDSASTYPFVAHLKTLAAEVSALLPSAQISYAADWSEFFGHQPADGSGDVYFHLDPLWSDSNIDAVSIDNYWPLSDWRDGSTHLDALAGYESPSDLAYLRSQMQGGEGYDYFYASDADRTAQVRTDIFDGTYGEHWVFRFKDVKGWWENEHHDRPGGVRSGSPTAWVPESKPIWFSEIGCGAVDRGSNQPNVFLDPKSSESFSPYFSSGARDDIQQRRHLRAFITWWDETSADFVEDQNPQSSVYSGRMVDTSRIMVYTWDARPYPQFPNFRTVWSDADNYETGQWLNGRASPNAMEPFIFAASQYGDIDPDGVL